MQEPAPTVPSIPWQTGRIVEPQPETTATPEPATPSSGSTAAPNTGSTSTNAMAALANRTRRERVQHQIDALEAAKTGDKVVVLYVYVGSDERRMARAKTICDQFEENVLNTLAVATEMQDCVCIRIDVEALTDEARREYGLVVQAPQLVIFDSTGRRLYRLGSSETPTGLAEKLKTAKTHNQRELDRQRR